MNSKKHFDEEMQVIKRYEWSIQLVCELQNFRKKRLREAIQAGEVNGDRIELFIFSRYGLLDESVVQRYRDIEALLANHVGEPILLVEEREVRSTFRLSENSLVQQPRMSEKTLQVGIISEASLLLEIKEGTFVFPTGGVHAEIEMPQGEVSSYGGNLALSFDMDLIFQMEPSLLSPDVCFGVMGGKQTPRSLKVLIGTEKIVEWLEQLKDKYPGYSFDSESMLVKASSVLEEHSMRLVSEQS